MSDLVCSTCNGTHRMDYRDTVVMCTRCPSPCFDCGKGGPYCVTTPCACGCHRESPHDSGDEHPNRDALPKEQS